MNAGLRVAVGFAGGLVFAMTGAIVGSQNAGWFGLERNANAALPALGVGTALLGVGFWSSSFDQQLTQTGSLGRAARILIVMASVAYIVSWLIEFAIIGTFTLGIGLVCLAIAVVRATGFSRVDRILIALSAVGSLTWNTETVSAFLLVGVGAIWMILSMRLLREPSQPLSA